MARKKNGSRKKTNRITFYGAAETVTGSRHYLEIRGKRLLIDCGLFQGRKENRLKNWEPFPVPPAAVDRVLLTHAHIDHSGFAPAFCRQGYENLIHCTKPTYELSRILLKDSAKIMEEDARWANKKGFSKHKPAKPLYTVKDAEKALKHFSPLYYDEDLDIRDDIRIKFKDAGHILGSSFVDIKVNNGYDIRKIVFTGDLGRPGHRFLLDPVQVFNIDYLVVESTYGDRLHDEASPENELERVINESVERGGVLVIPAFAVGRTQTVLFIIRRLEEEGRIPILPVFVDSPMAIDATDIFKRWISIQNLNSRLLTIRGKSVFQPSKLQLCRSKAQSKEINEIESNAIIISASGMATEGRILHHLTHRLPDPRNTILFCGYQVPGTRGRTMLEGKPEVKIHGRQVPINARIEEITGFSAHADYNEILAYLMGFNRPPERIFIVHGEPEAARGLKQKIEDRFGWDTVIPEFGESFELDL